MGMEKILRGKNWGDRRKIPRTIRKGGRKFFETNQKVKHAQTNTYFFSCAAENESTVRGERNLSCGKAAILYHIFCELFQYESFLL
jgi:hypothetical protein